MAIINQELSRIITGFVGPDLHKFNDVYLSVSKTENNIVTINGVRSGVIFKRKFEISYFLWNDIYETRGEYLEVQENSKDQYVLSIRVAE